MASGQSRQFKRIEVIKLKLQMQKPMRSYLSRAWKFSIQASSSPMLENYTWNSLQCSLLEMNEKSVVHHLHGHIHHAILFIETATLPGTTNPIHHLPRRVLRQLLVMISSTHPPC